MFTNLNEQILSPTDDDYEMSGVDPETGEVLGMSWDTTRAFREKLDREREDQEILDFYEAHKDEEDQ